MIAHARTDSGHLEEMNEDKRGIDTRERPEQAGRRAAMKDGGRTKKQKRWTFERKMRKGAQRSPRRRPADEAILLIRAENAPMRIRLASKKIRIFWLGRQRGCRLVAVTWVTDRSFMREDVHVFGRTLHANPDTCDVGSGTEAQIRYP